MKAAILLLGLSLVLCGCEVRGNFQHGPAATGDAVEKKDIYKSSFRVEETDRLICGVVDSFSGRQVSVSCLKK